MQTDTPSSVSDTESDTNSSSDILSIINKITSHQSISTSDIKNIKLKDIVELDEYKKLNSKQKSIIQSKINSMIEINDETNTNAFYVCKNCYYSNAIKPQTLIITKIGSDSSASYTNTDKLKNYINSKVLPRTRNYICNNKECESHKNHTKREAVFFRENESLQIWYTCCECRSVWKGE